MANYKAFSPSSWKAFTEQFPKDSALICDTLPTATAAGLVRFQRSDSKWYVSETDNDSFKWTALASGGDTPEVFVQTSYTTLSYASLTALGATSNVFVVLQPGPSDVPISGYNAKGITWVFYDPDNDRYTLLEEQIQKSSGAYSTYAVKTVITSDETVSKQTVRTQGSIPVFDTTANLTTKNISVALFVQEDATNSSFTYDGKTWTRANQTMVWRLENSSNSLQYYYSSPVMLRSGNDNAVAILALICNTTASTWTTQIRTLYKIPTVDSALDDTSSNPVQNQTITAKFAELDESLESFRSDVEGSISAIQETIAGLSGAGTPITLNEFMLAQLKTSNAERLEPGAYLITDYSTASAVIPTSVQSKLSWAQSSMYPVTSFGADFALLVMVRDKIALKWDAIAIPTHTSDYLATFALAKGTYGVVTNSHYIPVTDSEGNSSNCYFPYFTDITDLLNNRWPLDPWHWQHKLCYETVKNEIKTPSWMSTSQAQAFQSSYDSTVYMQVLPPSSGFGGLFSMGSSISLFFCDYRAANFASMPTATYIWCFNPLLYTNYTTSGVTATLQNCTVRNNDFSGYSLIPTNFMNRAFVCGANCSYIDASQNCQSSVFASSSRNVKMGGDALCAGQVSYTTLEAGAAARVYRGSLNSSHLENSASIRSLGSVYGAYIGNASSVICLGGASGIKTGNQCFNLVLDSGISRVYVGDDCYNIFVTGYVSDSELNPDDLGYSDSDNTVVRIPSGMRYAVIPRMGIDLNGNYSDSNRNMTMTPSKLPKYLLYSPYFFMMYIQAEGFSQQADVDCIPKNFSWSGFSGPNKNNIKVLLQANGLYYSNGSKSYSRYTENFTEIYDLLNPPSYDTIPNEGFDIECTGTNSSREDFSDSYISAELRWDCDLVYELAGAESKTVTYSVDSFNW